MEKRFNPTRCKVEARADGKPLIVGYGSVFYRAGVPGTQYQLWENTVERVAPTAFAAALQRRDDTRALFNHDASLILGRTDAGTMRLSVDDNGLRYEIDPPDSDIGRRVMEAIQRGDVSGSSFSFIVDKQSWETLPDGQEVRTIESVQLLDVGPVTFPAYEATSAIMRSGDGPDDARRQYDAWKAGQRAKQRAVAVRAALLKLDN